jgi:hypothetical protein
MFCVFLPPYILKMAIDKKCGLYLMIKRKVEKDGKCKNWVRFCGKLIIAWALCPANFSVWMMPIGICMIMGVSPGFYVKCKMIDFNLWRRCR